MRYEGRIFRPPSEARSLIIQVTVGCSHNKCTFCDMYKEKQFHMRPINDVLDDIKYARQRYRDIDKIFLADGDALIAKQENLVEILSFIRENIPECNRVTSYGSPVSILTKTPQQLKTLNGLNLDMIYLGLESGSDTVLSNVNKGETCDEIVRSGQMIKDAGMKLSVTAISGLAGINLWEEHAIATGKALSRLNPDYIGLLTLLFEDDTPLKRDWQDGRFTLLTPMEIMREMHLMISYMDCEGAVLRANHASNYVPIRGTLNKDRDRVLDIIEKALEGKIKFRGEGFRAR